LATLGYLWLAAASRVELQAYDQGNEEDELFVQNLALFLTSFLREHLTLIEGSSALRPQLISALQYLVKISYVQNSGAAVVKPADGPCCHALAVFTRSLMHT
jgi:hypothetical protein